MSIKHTIRSSKGDIIEVKLTPLSAIVKNCKECLGWSDNPENCTSPLCCLYPFRTGDSHITRIMSDKNKKAASKRMKAYHESKKA
jgi:hypothetical protein